MNENENHLPLLGICHRIFNSIKGTPPIFVLKAAALGCFGVLICRRLFVFIMQSLASPVTVDETEPSGGHFPRPRGEFGQIKTTGNLGRQLSKVDENGGEKVEDSETLVRATAVQARAPKKSVSINENVEEIIPSKKREKMKKMPSMGNEEEELKPLKSILKVGSRLNEKCNLRMVDSAV